MQIQKLFVIHSRPPFYPYAVMVPHNWPEGDSPWMRNPDNNQLRCSEIEGSGGKQIKFLSLRSPAGCPARCHRYQKRIGGHADELVVKDNVEQGIVDLQFTVVVDESQFAELPHEKTNA